MIEYLSLDALCSKAASFGVGDLGQTHISKAVEEISQVLPELWTTSVQAELVVEDVQWASKRRFLQMQKEVEVEKTSSATVGKGMPS